MSLKVLDPCCGSKMFWFDKNNQITIFGDKRQESHILCDGRALEIKPDVLLDFTDLPFSDCSFSCVVFDPPRLVRAGRKSWLAKKYGKLGLDWSVDIKKGFNEGFRVLKNDGILIFKWNETQIPISKLLYLAEYEPLFGHRSGKSMKTHWVTFMKNQRMKKS